MEKSGLRGTGQQNIYSTVYWEANWKRLGLLLLSYLGVTVTLCSFLWQTGWSWGNIEIFLLRWLFEQRRVGQHRGHRSSLLAHGFSRGFRSISSSLCFCSKPCTQSEHKSESIMPIIQFLSFITYFIHFFIKLLSFKHLNPKVTVWLLGLGPW